MRDNMENRGWRDIQRVSAEEEDKDLDYLRRKFGVTSTKVLDAIRAVGNDRHALEEYLRDQIGSYDPKRDAGPQQ